MNPDDWQTNDHTWRSPRQKNTIPNYNPTTQNHYWIVGIAYRWTPQTTFLDQENEVLISPPGCHYCEKFYNQTLAQQPCTGPPPH